ncbi:MAG TPA: PAS domain-containing protein [Vicinamibacterales bacterium]
MAVLLAVIALLEYYLPPSSGAPFLYIIAVLTSAALLTPADTMVVTWLSAALIAVGLFLSVTPTPLTPAAVMQRLLAIAAAVISAWQALRIRRTMRDAVEAESRFRRAIAHSPVSVYINDAGLRYTWISNPLPGFSAEDVIGRRDDELLPPETARELMALKEQVLATCRPQRRQLDVTIRGVRHSFDLSVQPIPDATGESAEGVMVTSTDITVLKDADEARRESESRLRLLTARFQTALRYSPILVFNQDTNLRYTWIYQGGTGVSAERALGRTDADIFGPDGAEDLTAFKRSVLDTSRAARREITVSYEGREMVFDLACEPLYDDGGRVVGITCAGIDLTDHKRQEQTLRARSTHLRLLSTIAARFVLLGPERRAAFGSMLPGLLRETARTFDLEICAHFELDEKAALLRLVSSTGLTASERTALATLPVGQPPCGLVASGRARLIIEDLQESAAAETMAGVPPGLQAYAGFPLLAEGRVLGTISFATRRRPHFSRDEVDVLQAVCDLLSAALHHARLDEALRTSEVRLRLATELAGVGTYERDLQTGDIYVSDQLAAMLKLPSAAPVPLADGRGMVHPDDRQRVAKISEALRDPAGQGTASAEVRVVRGDGETRWLFWSGKTFFGDSPAGRVPERALGAVIDITDQKVAAQQLAEREALYRTLTEAMPHIVFTTRPDGQTDYVSPQWLAYTGEPPEEGGGLLWTNVLHPDDRAATFDAWSRALATGQPFRAEGRFRRADGEYRWHLSRALPVRNASGHIIRWIGTCTDVHEARLATEALHEADRRKDEFMATLGHELRNPLSSIRVAVRLLEARYPQENEVQRLRAVIERQADQLTRLVDDLLDVSRITRNALDVRKRRVDVIVSLRSALEATRPAIEAFGHRLEVALPPTPLYVDGDPVRLTQVVSNLLANAAKYTPPGGHIALDAAREGNDVLIRVRDTGVGIPQDELPYVFELFYQAGPELQRPEGGLGVGLSLVRRLVEMHGGSVEAHSGGPGKGSEFVVRLPAAPEDAAPNG